jgi:hypothetical protein
MSRNALKEEEEEEEGGGEDKYIYVRMDRLISHLLHRLLNLRFL